MTDELPQTIDVALSSLAELAVEWWRLDRWANRAQTAAPHARHVARRLGKFLSAHGLEVVDITGRAYEPGLAVEVVDAIDDARLPAGAQVVDETVAPIVLLRGTVVRHGQVVVRRN
jgi:maleate cis-trans isomerase